MIDPHRARDFGGLLDRLQTALEARFKSHHVAIGPDTLPQPSHVIVHDRDLSHASATKAIREELDRIEPRWRRGSRLTPEDFHSSPLGDECRIGKLREA